MAQKYSDRLDTESFRLATVSQGTHPDLGTEIPSVTLVTHPLSTGPGIAYNALSYTWGSPRPSPPDAEVPVNRPILLNGHVHEVQPNLYDALLELEVSCAETPIWIDALCINQSSVKERTAQVSVMNHIYGKANRVIVWLGKPFPELEAGLRAAERISAESVRETFRMMQVQAWDFSADLSTMQERYGVEPFNEADCIGLVTLFMSNWLARVWIIQEVSLTDDVVILCNGKYTTFDCIGLASTFLHYSGLFQSAVNLASAKGRLGIYIRDDINFFQAERIQLLREWCKGEKSSWAGLLAMLDFEAGLGKDHPKSSPMLLLRLLFSTFGFKATDPRDTIYGLGGILKHMAIKSGLDFPAEFEPNYDIEAKDLLRNVACSIIQATDSLVYLTMVKDLSMRQTPGLPSWAPDFPPVLFNSVHGPQFRTVGAVNSSKYVPHTKNEHPFSIDGQILYASGIRIGVVRKVAEHYIEGIRGKLNLLGDILLSMDEIYPYTNQPSEQALWRTLIWDTDWSTRPTRMVHPEDFQRRILEQLVNGLISQSFQTQGSKSEKEDFISASIKKMAHLDAIAEKFPSSIFPSTAVLRSACISKGLIQREEGEDLDDDGFQKLQRSNHAMPPGSLMGAMWSDHRPFLTDTGYLGMGFPSTENGDELWIVSGSPTPLVLRKTGVKENEYTMIGETYTHGAMQGEAVADDAKWEKIQIV